MCPYSSSCGYDTCSNGRLALACKPARSPFGGKYGNGLGQPDQAQIGMRQRLGGLCLLATEDIAACVAIREYLGEMLLVSPSWLARHRNRGFLLQMRETPASDDGSRVCIDAERFGGLTRFMNHACDQVAGFHEVAGGTRRCIIAVTRRASEKGKEITVSYGDHLWFVCWCGSGLCIHRDIQDQAEP